MSVASVSVNVMPAPKSLQSHPQSSKPLITRTTCKHHVSPDPLGAHPESVYVPAGMRKRLDKKCNLPAVSSAAVPFTVIVPSPLSAKDIPVTVLGNDVYGYGIRFRPHAVTFAGCTPARVYGLSGLLSPSPVSVVAPSTAARRSAPVGDTSSMLATVPEAVPVSTLAYRSSLSPAV